MFFNILTLLLVVLELDFLANDNFDGLEGLLTHAILGEISSLRQRLRIVNQCFIDEAALVHAEAL